MDTGKRNRTIISVIIVFIVLIIVFYAFRHGIQQKEAGQQQAEQQKESQQVCSAMYVSFGKDSYIFVDTENGNVFTVHFPEEIYNVDGEKISEDDLKKGSIVRIYGDGIMLESYPGQYPGVTRIEVTEEGTSADADKYQYIIDEVYQEPDPSAPPLLNLEYEIPMASVSAMTNTGAYNWGYQNTNGTAQEDIADTAHVLLWKEINDLNLEAGTDMKLRFSQEPDKVSALRWKEEERKAETDGSEFPEGEKISVQKTNDQWYLPEAEPGYVYLIQGEWENGRVEYGFLT